MPKYVKSDKYLYYNTLAKGVSVREVLGVIGRTSTLNLVELRVVWRAMVPAAGCHLCQMCQCVRISTLAHFGQIAFPANYPMKDTITNT